MLHCSLHGSGRSLHDTLGDMLLAPWLSRSLLHGSLGGIYFCLFICLSVCLCLSVCTCVCEGGGGAHSSRTPLTHALAGHPFTPYSHWWFSRQLTPYSPTGGSVRPHSLSPSTFTSFAPNFHHNFLPLPFLTFKSDSDHAILLIVLTFGTSAELETEGWG